jgi:VanZ family protein
MPFPLSSRTAKVAAIGITISILFLSLLPLSQVPVGGGDKLHHLLAYAGLMFAWTLAFAQYAKPATQILLAASCILFGIGVEVAQGMSGYRFFDWFDALANSVGVFLGWLAAQIVTRMRIVEIILTPSQK